MDKKIIKQLAKLVIPISLCTYPAIKKIIEKIYNEYYNSIIEKAKDDFKKKI